MQTELEEEAKNDEDLYDKLACWCETNDKEKTKAIEDGKQKITELSAAIEENTALASTRETEVGALKGEAATLEKGLADSAALRAKENAEFNSEEKDLIQSIGSLKGAVSTLGKQHGEGLLQQQKDSLLQVAHVLRRHRNLAEAAVRPHQRAQVRALLREPQEAISLLQTTRQDYEPQSGAIFGILKQMKETFETNMETGKKEEAQSDADYTNLKSTKEEELKATNDKIFTKSEEMAKATEISAQSKESLEDTTTTLEADTEFLSNLKAQCADIDKQWEARSKVRSEEIAAVSETIGILTDDDARDTFSASLGLIQARSRSKRETQQRERTAAYLANEGERLRSPRISYLSVRVRNDAFAKVKESIEGMVVQLGHEQEDEVGKKDGCVSDFNTNEKQTTERNTHKVDVETEIADLTAEITAKRDEEAALKQEIADTQMEMKKAAENREQENKDFQQTVSDQQATQAILKKALDRLADFYKKKAAFLQAHHRQAPPVTFAPYKKQSSGGAMGLIENVMEESKETEADALAAENEAQAAYESFVKGANKQIEAMASQITNDEEVVAEDTKKEVEDEGDKRATIHDILKP